ncbi:MAG: polyisoprenoid-binding protein [Aquabacterium sp.]|uniref:YceI family protein n=1 Tax=Aquabacterium sp. TaxID=1872578 RepID=UPI0025B99FFF|nr:YceI family protein [Aquabacterium sp.]MBI5926785.1 polyisoprenoid-binding protein [Aquabacterium sp.]
MKQLTQLFAATSLAFAFATSALAAPETYGVEPNHTYANFSYNHMGLSTQISKFSKTSGTVVYDKAAKTGSVDVTIDMKSVDTGSSLFNGHIQGADFLDTEKFPTATFKSTKVVFEGDKPATIEGQLTIKGITKPVTLKVSHFSNMEHPMAKRDAIGANASTQIKRTEFNAGKYAPLVGDDVTITISLEAIKQ